MANKLTQAIVAAHLDLDQSAVSRLLEKLKINVQTSTLDQVRTLYIRHLRDMAAGHKSEDGDDLVRERVLTERIDREIKQFILAEKKGLLINVGLLEPELMQMVGAFRSELLSRDDKLKSELDALYAVDIDLSILNEHTFAALEQLVRYDASQQGFNESLVPVAAAAGENNDDGVGAALPEVVG